MHMWVREAHLAFAAAAAFFLAASCFANSAAALQIDAKDWKLHRIWTESASWGGAPASVAVRGSCIACALLRSDLFLCLRLSGGTAGKSGSLLLGSSLRAGLRLRSNASPAEIRAAGEIGDPMSASDTNVATQGRICAGIRTELRPQRQPSPSPPQPSGRQPQPWRSPRQPCDTDASISAATIDTVADT